MGDEELARAGSRRGGLPPIRSTPQHAPGYMPPPAPRVPGSKAEMTPQDRSRKAALTAERRRNERRTATRRAAPRARADEASACSPHSGSPHSDARALRPLSDLEDMP